MNLNTAKIKLMSD